MAKQTINQGTPPFGEGGDDIRVGTAKLQANDDELYAFLGASNGTLAAQAARAALGLGSVDNTSDVDKPVSTATQNALNQKANTVDVNNALALKANTTEVNTALAGKADLVGGFIPTSQIPAIAITEFLGNVTTDAAMLALVGQKGDWCIRTDMGKAYIITGASSSLITDWTEWVYPVSPVTSVNGQVGVVTLNYTNVGADAAGSAATVQSNLDTHAGNLLNPHGVTKAQVGLGNVDNTSDLNKPISTATQTALNAKANSTDVNTALSLKADLVDGKVPASQLQVASTTQAGIVKLINNLVTGGASDSLSAEAGKLLLNMFATSHGVSGYVKIANPSAPTVPTIIQWHSVASANQANTVATHPIAFPNNCYKVIACGVNSGGSVVTAVTTNFYGLSSVTFNAFVANAGNALYLAAAGQVTINYIAIGN